MIGGFFSGEKRSEKWQTAMQIETINRAQDRQSRQGKLEDEQVTVCLENTRHFAQRSVPVFHVAQTERNGNAIE